VYRAHEGERQALSAAQRAMLERYSGAVHRYLCGALRDAEAADELFQEFCLRFLRGYFRNASPDRGRFRDFLKTSVFHLIVDHRKRLQKQHRMLSPEIEEPGARTATESRDEFLASWREELITQTWLALQKFESATGQPHYTVLRYRSERPEVSSELMSQELGTRLGKTFSVHAVRQALHRAREKFAELFLNEVACSLENPTHERMEAELIDLSMIAHCRSALDRLYRK
jgi:RNA polymerase sigma-70 factor (ECF subfamily)